MMWSVAVIDRVAFSVGPIQVYWYGLIMGVAMLLGIYLALREGKKQGIDSDEFSDLILWSLLFALIGARLYYVIFEWNNLYADQPGAALAFWQGGLAIHGGLIGALTAAYIMVRKRNHSFFQLADIVAPSIILGQAIGRWGNFINQEAHGGPVSASLLEGLHLPPWLIEQMTIHGVTYHPTFLYESLWNLLGFGFLLLMRYWNPKRGEIFFTYVIWYSIGRFFIEGLRTDSLAWDGPDWLAGFLQWLWSPMQALFTPGVMSSGDIRVAQLISILLIVLSILSIIWRRKKKEAEPAYREAYLESTAKKKKG